MNTGKIISELQDNIIVTSVLISIIVTGILAITFKFGLGMTVLIYFVIAAIAYMGIKPLDEGK